MKRIIFTVIFCVASSSAVWADTSLQSQLESVAQAEASGKAAEQKKIDDAKLEAEKEERAWKQRRAAAVNAANKKASDRAAAIAAQNAKIEAKQDAAIKRDQSYEDKLREIELRRQELDLKRQEARANRENDYIDQELKHQSAETDVVKSEADATRAVSSGAKTLMEKEGEARVKKESSWLN